MKCVSKHRAKQAGVREEKGVTGGARGSLWNLGDLPQMTELSFYAVTGALFYSPLPHFLIQCSPNDLHQMRRAGIFWHLFFTVGL